MQLGFNKKSLVDLISQVSENFSSNKEMLKLRICAPLNNERASFLF